MRPTLPRKTSLRRLRHACIAALGAIALAACVQPTEPSSAAQAPRLSEFDPERCIQDPNIVAAGAASTPASAVIVPASNCLEDKDPNGPGYFLNFSLDECRQASQDLDLDGFADYCENSLAQSFAPMMKIHPFECSGRWWDSDRIGGEYYYVVQPAVPNSDRLRYVPENVVHIVYMPAYYADCGYAGHPGDSEFIGVEVGFDAETNHWFMNRALLSAHCGSPWDISDSSNCGWRSAFKVGALKALGAPIVVVAEGKHANYASEDECETWDGLDACSSSSYDFRFPVYYVQKNAGSRAVPLPWSEPCPKSSPNLAFMTDPEERECLWANSTAFRGWQPDGYPIPNTGGSTPYGYVLSAYFNF